MTGIIDSGWRCYAEQCVPLDTSSTERLAKRRAYYAGAQQMFVTIVNNAGGTDAEFADLTPLFVELTSFLEAVRRGSA